MCSLFHAFILSQLWTVYLEQVQPHGNTKEELLLAPSILLDFWVKVTPGILQLVSHSKVLAEMVNLHFLSLMEALLECRSTILAKLMPLWCPVLHAYNTTVGVSNINMARILAAGHFTNLASTPFYSADSFTP